MLGMNSPSSQPIDVSVVIATYNMGRYLPAALDSVLAQRTTGSLEVIVVDDGSTDDTKERMVPYLRDKRVRYLYQDNAGQTKAKNVGIRAAHGRYIGFCDADDLWRPWKLAVQLPVLEANADVAVVYSRMRPIDAGGGLLPEVAFPEYSGYVTRKLFLENFITFGAALVSRAALEAVGGFDETRRMGIDWDLWLRLSVNYRFQCVPVEVYYYRVWDGQMSKDWRGRYASAFSIMRDFEARHPGVIDPATHRKAYAQSYANRGQIRAKLDNDRLGCIADALRSMCYGSCFDSSLRTLAKAFIRFPYR